MGEDPAAVPPLSEFVIHVVFEVSPQTAGKSCYRSAATLSTDDFLEPADLFLDLPPQIFDLTFGFHTAILDYLSDNLLDRTFHPVHLAFSLVFCA